MKTWRIKLEDMAFKLRNIVKKWQITCFFFLNKKHERTQHGFSMVTNLFVIQRRNFIIPRLFLACRLHCDIFYAIYRPLHERPRYSLSLN